MVRVPEEHAEIDDEFGDGEEHYRVQLSAVTASTLMQRCSDCGQWAGPGHACSGTQDERETGGPQEGSKSDQHVLSIQPAEPVDFTFIRNPDSSQNYATNQDFGQDLEPTGRYMSEGSGFVPEGWESGTVRFEQPLHLDYGQSTVDWKRSLSEHYDGATGQALSQALRDDGYDAILTHDKYGTSEVIDLTHLSPASTDSQQSPGVSSSPSSDLDHTPQCSMCGRFEGPGHDCPQGAQADAVERQAQSWRESLTDQERQAHEDYGSILHADLNETLRQAGPRALPTSLDDDDLDTIQHLDAALARAPRTNEPHTVYRGIQTGRTNSQGEPVGSTAQEWIARNAVPGQSLALHGYTSTSMNRQMAGRFSGTRADHPVDGVVFEIETTNAASWGTGVEAEITFARNTSFEVLSVDQQQVDGQDRAVVRLREITPQVPADPAQATPRPQGRAARGPEQDPAKWNRRRKHTPKDAFAFARHLEAKHGVQVWMRGGPDQDSFVSLDQIMVPKDKRGDGLGQKVMTEIVAEADRNGWAMALTPDSEWGSSVPRLRKFYAAFGFVPNKGRNKDYRTQEAMIRLPQ